MIEFHINLLLSAKVRALLVFSDERRQVFRHPIRISSEEIKGLCCQGDAAVNQIR